MTEIVVGDKNTPCRLFDADGVEITYATHANLVSGVVTQYETNEHGNIHISRDEQSGEARARKIQKVYKAPLRFEKIKS